MHVTEPQANPLRDWLDSIERLRVIPDSVLVLPAHERPFLICMRALINCVITTRAICSSCSTPVKRRARRWR